MKKECECNYHLGMGPNLKCPVHGKDLGCKKNKEIKKSRFIGSAVDCIVSLLRSRVAALFCGFITACFTWMGFGISMETWGSIEHPEYWMFYGVMVFKICSWLADRVFDFVYKVKG